MSDLGSEGGSGRVAAAVVVATTLTVGLVVLVLNDHQWGGPVIFTLTGAHGVHLFDLPVLVAWMVGLRASAHLARRG